MKLTFSLKNGTPPREQKTGLTCYNKINGVQIDHKVTRGCLFSFFSVRNWDFPKGSS